MKKYFLYELKKNLLPTVIITVFACIIYLTGVLSTDFDRQIYYDFTTKMSTYPDSLINIPIVILMILCTLVPVWMFAFKMKARQCDLYYSMPLRREKIYLVKALVGLFIIFAAYSVSYWLGFVATAIKPNHFDLIQFVPAYFLTLPFGVLLFGICAFVFTRANKLVDGVIFICLYIAIASIPVTLVIQIMRYAAYASGSGYLFSFAVDPLYFNIYMALTWVGTIYQSLASGRIVAAQNSWIIWVFAIVVGIAAWVGLFLSARKEKAENAERTSDSKFGYVVLIPYYAFMMLATIGVPLLLLGVISSLYSIYAVIILTAAFIGYVIFRRTVRLKKCDWIVLAAAIVAGIAFSLIIYAVFINTWSNSIDTWFISNIYAALP